jgi:hypothetical protein
VQYEAQLENDNGYFLHWPLHVSSLSSLGLGLYARGRYKADPSDTEKREADLASTTAIGVGVFWLAATGVIHYGRPYASILNRAKKTKEKDRRGELFRERIAEEGMEANAKMIRTLAFLSILSNAYAAFTVGINHDPGVSKIAFGVGVLAFTPWVFEHRYLNIYEKHLEYKRKIYTPISYLDFGVDQKSQQLYPKLAMQWSF